jgi:molybdenum cofactor cytidylyltransferase
MISAIILAAGQSKRMGSPKMLLPWGKQTVIERVIRIFLAAGIEDIVVVTGGAGEQVSRTIEQYPVRTIFNSQYAAEEMLVSLQCGLRVLMPHTEAALIGLGDQPQIQEETVRMLCEAYAESKSMLIVPSFGRRRGHPWLVTRALWAELLAMSSSESPRDFLNRRAAEIQYVDVGTPSILADLDTPSDYENFHP